MKQKQFYQPHETGKAIAPNGRYLEARNGKGSVPRNCNSKAFLDNYDRIFGKKKVKK